MITYSVVLGNLGNTCDSPHREDGPGAIRRSIELLRGIDALLDGR